MNIHVTPTMPVIDVALLDDEFRFQVGDEVEHGDWPATVRTRFRASNGAYLYGVRYQDGREVLVLSGALYSAA